MKLPEFIEVNEENKQPKETTEVKQLRKDFFRTVIFILAALYVLTVATIAWFAKNEHTKSNTSVISANGMGIELRTHGSSGIHDDILKTIMNDGTNSSFWYKLPFAPKDYTETSAGEPTINWLLSDSSAAGNYSDEESDWEEYWQDEDHKRQEKAIEPGSHGTLSFSVVPYYSGNITVNCELSLIPYDVTEDGYSEIAEDAIERELVNGHILFFLVSEGNKLVWIRDGSFELVIPDAVAETEYEYTLYWCWPQTFAEAVLKDGDDYLNGRTTLFSEYTNGGAIREAVVKSDDYSMKNLPKRYFYSNLTNATLEQNQKDLLQIENIYNVSTSTLEADHMSEEAMEAFVELSSYYNQADQYIGGHIKFVRIKLTATAE